MGSALAGHLQQLRPFLRPHRGDGEAGLADQFHFRKAWLGLDLRQGDRLGELADGLDGDLHPGAVRAVRLARAGDPHDADRRLVGIAVVEEGLVAGLHGAQFRAPDGAVSAVAETPAFIALKRRLVDKTAWMDGVLIEDKGAAVAAHYRLAPAYDTALEGIMRDFAAEAGPGWVLQPGKMVFEIRPSRADKGEAVAAYLEQMPFAGRLPIAIGDDLTDETMFALANARGGQSIRVGSLDTATAALAKCSSPSALRSALSIVAAADVRKVASAS